MSVKGFSLRIDRLIQDYQENSASIGLHSWDARVKIALLVTAVGMNVVIAKLWLSLILFIISLGLIFWSRIPIPLFTLFFFAPAWATLIVFLGFSIGFGTKAVFTLGPITFYKEGILQGVSAAARVANDMSWMAAVFLTTPFTKLIEALRWFRIPVVLVDAIEMTYRYAFLLIDEFFRMKDAARAKGGLYNYRKVIVSTSMILAQIILRAYDRAKRIQESMAARGSAAEGVNAMNGIRNLKSNCNECIIAPEHGNEAIPVLSCKNINYAYFSGGKEAIKHVSLTVSQGEIVVLCGPNGSGKTTLLKLISGILPLSGGQISLLDQKLDSKMRNNVFRIVGILFQDPNDQLFCTHVREDIAYGPKNLGLDEDEIECLVNKAMEMMEVQHLAERPIHRLSFGEMRRVGLAGLLAMRPSLILLDEPTAYLDPTSARQLILLVRELNTHYGFTFIIVTHDMDVASMLAKRIIVLKEGTIIADGLAKTILTDEDLLARSRLEPPILTKLFIKVMKDSSMDKEIPINIDEAVRILQSWKS